MVIFDIVDIRDITDPLTEKEFQSRVERCARLTGWLFCHTYNSRRSTSGYPDLTLCKPERGTLFAELKTDAGKLTCVQREWLLALLASGETACLWRPRHLEDILRYLAGEISQPPGLAGEGEDWEE